MSINSLRKKLLEQKENGTLNAGYTALELPMMNQNSADTYTPPETVVPYAQPKTTPISTNTQTPKTTQPTSPVTKPTTTTAKNASIPSSAKNSSQAKADPKSGEAGAKALKAIQASDPMIYIKKNKFLAEAYNAGFYGTDITREARDNARAGGYLEQIEAMINAGKQDSKGKPTNDKSEKSDNSLSTEAAREEKISQKSIDNQVKSGYTAGNTTGNTNTADKNNNTGNTRTTGKTNTVGNTNTTKNTSTGKNTATGDVPKMGEVEDSQEEAEAEQQNSGANAKKATSAIDPGFGDAGKKILSQIQKSDPTIFIKKNKALTEAYKAGMNGVDISKELKDNASAGGYWDAVWSIYKAGETDSKAGSGDTKLDRVGNVNYDKKNLNPWSKDFDYMKNMMFLNGAGSSENQDVQTLYRYFTNPANQNKQIPQEILNAFENFKNNINGEQKTRTSEIASRRLGDSSKDYSYDDIKTRNKFFGYPTAGGKLDDGGYHGDDKGKGIDINGLPLGTPICAVADGMVYYRAYYVIRDGVKYYCSYGLYAKLKVEGTKDHYIFAHLDPSFMYNNGLVSNPEWEKVMGDMEMKWRKYDDDKDWFELGSRYVHKGDIIGYLGTSGNSSGPHLHFGYFPNGTNVNPLEKGFSNYKS